MVQKFNRNNSVYMYDDNTILLLILLP